MRLARSTRLYVILCGSRYEGFLVNYATVDADAAQGAWANLKGRQPRDDHRFQVWADGKMLSEEVRDAPPQ